MRVFCLLIAATFLVACGTTTTTNAGGTGPRGSALEDGGVGSGEIPLPDLTTEPKRDVSFPGSEPFTYYAFAVGGDGALTVAASTNTEIVLVGYTTELTRQFVLSTKEVMDAAVVRQLVPRGGGGAVVEYSDLNTLLHEGYIAAFLADGSPAHAVIHVPRAAYAMAIDPENRVVYGTDEGTIGDDSSFRAVVRRVTPSGAADATFGIGAKASISCIVGRTTAPTLLATDATGGIVALVEDGSGAFFLAKLTPTGTLDTTFGSAGCAPLAPLTKEHLVMTSIAIDETGTIWLSGAVQSGSHLDHGAVAKFLPTGSIDPSFGTGGFVELIPDTNSSNIVRSVHPRGTELLVLNEQYVANRTYRRDIFTLDAHGKRAAQPLIADSNYLDFKLTANGLNLYWLQQDRAGRIATPRP